MRILSIDYGEVRTGFAISDELGFTAQGLETINSNGCDKLILKKIDEFIDIYNINTIVVGMPYHMNGDISERAELTNRFIHKLKCKYNKIKIDFIDERLTTVLAYKTMNLLGVNKNKKKNIVDTISAVYILETYLNKINSKS